MSRPLRLSSLVLLLALPACTDPRLNAGVSIGTDGVTVRPTISTVVPGGGTVTYTP